MTLAELKPAMLSLPAGERAEFAAWLLRENGSESPNAPVQLPVHEVWSPMITDEIAAAMLLYIEDKKDGAE